MASSSSAVLACMCGISGVGTFAVGGLVARGEETGGAGGAGGSAGGGIGSIGGGICASGGLVARGGEIMGGRSSGCTGGVNG